MEVLWSSVFLSITQVMDKAKKLRTERRIANPEQKKYVTAEEVLAFIRSLDMRNARDRQLRNYFVVVYACGGRCGGMSYMTTHHTAKREADGKQTYQFHVPSDKNYQCKGMQPDSPLWRYSFVQDVHMPELCPIAAMDDQFEFIKNYPMAEGPAYVWRNMSNPSTHCFLLVHI